MNCKAMKRFCHAGAGMALALLLLAGCAGIPVQVVGSEHRLTLKEGGNLADDEASTAPERVAVLTAALKDRREELGGAGIGKDELTFTPYAESVFILPNGETQVLTVLYQTYQGARVLDAVQCGGFDQKTGELRALRATLKDPAKLPEPPQADMGAWAKAHQVFREYLRQHKAAKIDFTVDEQPVVSAALGVAGYLAHYSRRNPDTSLSRFAAIVDPATGSVHVLNDSSTD